MAAETCRWVFRHRRLLMTAAAFLCLPSLLWNSHWILRDPAMHVVIAATGIVLVLTGELIRLAAISEIHGRKTEALVTTGVYAKVRNPLYAGNLIAGTGLVFISGSVSMLVIFLVTYVGVYRTVVHHEEQKLAQRHPVAYAEYMATVPRFVPGSFSLSLSGLRTLTWKKFAYETPNAMGLSASVIFLLVLQYATHHAGFAHLLP